MWRWHLAREAQLVTAPGDGVGNHGTWHPDSEYEIVLRHEDVDRRSQEILARYSVPADRSPELMAMKASPALDPSAGVTADVTTDEPPATPTSAASQ